MYKSIIGSIPQKHKTSKGNMQRVGERSKKKMHFPKNIKVKCNHYDCNTCISGSDFGLHCMHCESHFTLTNFTSNIDMQIEILNAKKARSEIDNYILIATNFIVTLQSIRCECMYTLRTIKGW